jgi:hypothetical protein
MSEPCQVKKWIMPGCWEDSEGNAHFSIPEIHAVLGIPDTDAEREDTARMMTAMLSRMLPSGRKIIIEKKEL